MRELRDGLMVEIYQVSKSPTQSGRAGRSLRWKIRYGIDLTQKYEPLMSWFSSSDPLRRVQIDHFTFASKEKAIEFVEKNLQLAYIVYEKTQRVINKKSYGNNYPNLIGDQLKMDK